MKGPDKTLIRSALVLLALGSVGVIAAYCDRDQRTRFLANWLLWFTTLMSISLGCLFLVGLEHLVSARWSVPLRRVPERLSGLLWLLLPLSAVMLFDLPQLYCWARPAAKLDPILRQKAIWLNESFFSLRFVACLLTWLIFYFAFVFGSLRQDRAADQLFPCRAKRLAPLFMISFALTVSISAFDWLMSLEPHWFSTIMGVYLFSGCVVSGLAATILLTLYLQTKGRLSQISADHLYNLGALLFGFNAFWAYIAFSQFMLIWYGNLPEETVFFAQRLHGSWLWLSAALPIAHFFVPFFALLSQSAKCDRQRLCWVSVLILASHALDLYWFIFPSFSTAAIFSWQECAFGACFIGLGLVTVAGFLRLGNDMPEGDPNLRQALEFRL